MAESVFVQHNPVKRQSEMVFFRKEKPTTWLTTLKDISDAYSKMGTLKKFKMNKQTMISAVIRATTNDNVRTEKSSL